MDVCDTKLEIPNDFPFPFTPYSIQEDFMQNLYKTLEEGKLGIFESPTGTGKSMSLICGSLKWLLDAEKRFKNDVESKIEKVSDDLKIESTGGDWLEVHSRLSKKRQERDRLRDLLKKVVEFENRINEIEEKNKTFKSKRIFKDKKCGVSSDENCENIENFEDCDELLEEDVTSNVNLEDYDEDCTGKQEEKYNGIKIFLCSRTHSQLTQLVNEIIKSPFKDLNIRVVTLASRQNSCINDSVLKLKSLSLINEKCLDLQKKEEKVTKISKKGEQIKRQKLKKGCEFYKQSNVENLKVKILSEIQDIESLASAGKELHSCPYYASRHALDEAQVVIIPYTTLLHKATRLACGISLKDSVVIIDEAHNLLDAIGNMYSSSVSGQELIAGQSLLTQYKNKYSERLSALTMLHFNQLLFIITRLQKKIEPHVEEKEKVEGGSVETLAEFVFSCEIDTINLYKILEFVNKSKLLLKLRTFAERQEPLVSVFKKEERGVSTFLKTISSKKNAPKEVVVKTESTAPEDYIVNKNCLLNITNFIECLTHHCSDGRIVVSRSKTTAKSSLKFLLLNPASQFSDIVKEARSVVVAGGTMQPFSEFSDQLFLLAGADSERIHTFACDHIIPPHNILPIIVSEGPSGKMLDFSFEKRKSPECLDEFGRILTNMCNVVPAGMVCFFPSYEYENFAFNYLEKTGVINKLQKKKKVLREPKKSSEVENVLTRYGRAAREGGALLMSVVGGKLSEGLNFNDDLGRCVVVVGLPYPNSTSPELKEKMAYLNSSVGPGAGKVYYENLCMKAVNQSIGRSVRHKEDYACVLLVDRRYSRPSCVKALPDWIKKSLRNEPKFGPVIGLVSKFFHSKKKSKIQY